MSGQFTTGSILKYAILPRILPRASSLFLSGFAQIAFLMAQIYRGVRLLPENHPYLLAANIGKYNMRQVVAAASGNLTYRWQNIDQIIVFYALLAGFILLGLQAFFLLINLFMPMASAGPILSFGTYFGTPTYDGLGPRQDLAFILLDRIFGVPGIFDSCVSAGTPCYGTLPDLEFDTTFTVFAPPAAEFPWPYHLGLHAMMQFYSLGLLVIAVFVIIYFVIVIIAETAQTGTPFGKRFNSVWAPIRLVMALGLLIPITFGLNSAQFITLYVAKFGSNFASNGWLWFNREVVSWGIAQAPRLVAKPQAPEVENLLQFMMLAHACKALEESYILQPRPVAPGGATTCTGIDEKDDGIPSADPDDNQPENYIDAYLVKFDLSGTNDARRLVSTDWQDARGFFENSDITIRFGDRSCYNTNQLGRVEPTCGEITIPAVNPSSSSAEIGSLTLQANFYETVRYLWGEYGDDTGLVRRWRHNEICDPVNANANFLETGGNGDLELRKKAIAQVQQEICLKEGEIRRDYPTDKSYYSVTPASFQTPPDGDWRVYAATHYREGAGAFTTPYPGFVAGHPDYPGSMQVLSPFNTTLTLGTVNPVAIDVNMIAENAIREALQAQTTRIATGDYEMPIDHLSRGWAGAGMWYNQIARLNGSFTTAAWNYPNPTRFPQIMESVQAKLRQNNQNMTPIDQFEPNLGGRQEIQLPRPNETTSAIVLNKIYKGWGQSKSIHKPPTGNFFLDVVNWLFGTKGLFNLSDPVNAQVNPLALLSSLGKTLVETSIRNIGGASVGMAIAAISSATKIPVGEAIGDMISNFLFAISASTLLAGITLYYILPFLPFVYFFFAVGNWLKGVFEAMVGVPLWALAHLRIDGNGLPGEAAMNGYYMLFEIFLRPILTLFGLLASVSIFSAMATVLNGIWPIATKNLGGANYDMAATTGWAESVRGPIDQLFYTIMYAVVLYIMALSSFKLIDLIPSQMLRWLGTAVSTFSDMTGDAASQFSGTAQGVTGSATSTAIGTLKGVGSTAKSLGNAVGNMASSK